MGLIIILFNTLLKSNFKFVISSYFFLDKIFNLLKKNALKLTKKVIKKNKKYLPDKQN